MKLHKSTVLSTEMLNRLLLCDSLPRDSCWDSRLLSTWAKWVRDSKE